MTPYYSKDGITIYHGDCRIVSGWIPLVNLVLTDPPYGVNKADWDSEFPMWMFDKFGGFCDVMGVMPGSANLGLIPQVAGDLKCRCTLAAYITNGMTRSAVGFANWIPCVVYAREGASIHADKQDAKEFTIHGRKNRHPSPKPLDVTQWFLDTLPGELVLDPFMGSGTTLLAAKRLGREAIGIEIDERYCEMAARRLDNFRPLPLFAPEPQPVQRELMS